MVPDPERLAAPEGWLEDEPAVIPDPDEHKPDDWDDAAHGEWVPTAKVPNPRCKDAPGCGPYTPPRIRNPAYKGRWHPKRIPNPAFKGVWTPKRIPNPDYHEDLHPHNLLTIVGAGFEDWMVEKNVGFANVYIGTDEEAVRKWNEQHFIPKSRRQQAAKATPTPTPTPTPTAPPAETAAPAAEPENKEGL
jgi:calnexin